MDVGQDGQVYDYVVAFRPIYRIAGLHTDRVHLMKHIVRIILGLELLQSPQILAVDVVDHRVTR